MSATSGPIETMIALAEDKIYREMRLRFMEDATSEAIAGTTGTAGLGDGPASDGMAGPGAGEGDGVRAAAMTGVGAREVGTDSNCSTFSLNEVYWPQR